MSAGEDENAPIQESGQPEPFFITEEVEAELIATGYEFEPPSHARTVSIVDFGWQPDETIQEAIARRDSKR